jgi:hypothetical protein
MDLYSIRNHLNSWHNMASQIINNAAFLRTSREFPEDMHGLARETNKSYIEIADKVNNRIIGFFTVNRASITGESWFLENNQRQQSFRQVFIVSSTSAINHGITVIVPSQFIRCFGSYTDGTNTYGLIFGTSVAIAGQISFYLTSTQIVFVTGAGAPTLTSGTIVLEWISQP